MPVLTTPEEVKEARKKRFDYLEGFYKKLESDPTLNPKKIRPTGKLLVFYRKAKKYYDLDNMQTALGLLNLAINMYCDRLEIRRENLGIV